MFSSRIVCPFLTSEPFWPMSWEGVTLVKISISSSLSSSLSSGLLENSTITTASAPSGIGAPVLISTHFPSSTVLSVNDPASKKSMTLSFLGFSSLTP